MYHHGPSFRGMGGKSLRQTALIQKSVTLRPCIFGRAIMTCWKTARTIRFRQMSVVHYLSCIWSRQRPRPFSSRLIESENGAKYIVDAVHKFDPLTVLSHIFAYFNKLISARRGDNETFKNFEGHFATLISKFKSHGNKINLPESLTAFLLLSISNVDDHQRISIIAATAKDLALSISSHASSSNPLSTPRVTSVPVPSTSSCTIVIIDDFRNVCYETVASILRQCGRRGQHGGQFCSGNSVNLNSNHRGRHSGGRGFSGRGGLGLRRCSADDLR